MPTCSAAMQASDPVMRAEHWPLWASLPLGPVLPAAGCARAWAAEVLWEWGLSALADPMQLVASELVANAVAAARAMDGGPFPVLFWLRSDGKRLLLVVWDACTAPPAQMDPAEDVEAGRGLMLVAALSEKWGWYPAAWDRIEGKAVWALVADG